MIDEFISYFGLHLDHITKLENRFYLVNHAQMRFKAKKPLAIGLFLGFSRKKTFIPSNSLLSMVSNTGRKVVVNAQGEWLFVCGRDVFKDSVLKFGVGSPGDFVLVVNERNVCLGYGELVLDNRLAVRNVYDIGDYFRREH